MKNMKFESVVFSIAAALVLSACGDSPTSSESAGSTSQNSGLHSSSSPEGALVETTAVASDWTTSAGLELQNSVSEISLVELAAATASDACDVSDDQHVNVALSDTVTNISQPYTPGSSDFIASVATNLVRIDPSSDLFGMLQLEVRSDSSGEPGETIATSGSVDVSMITNSSTTEFHTFEFAEPVSVAAGTSYHFVLVANGGYNGDSSRQIRWVYDDVFGTNCGAPFSPLMTLDSGWNAFGRVAQIRLNSAAQYDVNQYSELALDGTNESTWDLSTFTVDENPNGESGSLLYDIGADSNSSPQYSALGLTQSQVRAQGDLVGRYFFIRAHFEATGGGSKDATLGEVNIDRYE